MSYIASSRLIARIRNSPVRAGAPSSPTYSVEFAPDCAGVSR
jgi:hypothetical protein